MAYKMVLGLVLLVAALLNPPYALAAGDATTVLLVMDTSASMKESDPGDLRSAAGSLLVDILEKEDRMGVITFSDRARVASPVLKVGGREEELKKALRGEDSGGTDLDAALEAALAELRRAGVGSEAFVLLLSDGQQDDWRGDALAGFAAGNWPVYTVALGPAADLNALGEMARSTGGQLFVAETPSRLMSVFVRFLVQAENYDTLLQEERVADGKDSFSFATDEYTEKLMVFLFSDGVRAQIRDPAEGATPVVFHHTERWPGPGRWRIDLSGEGPYELLVLAEKTVKVQLVRPRVGTVLDRNRPFEAVFNLIGDTEGFELKGTLYPPGEAGRPGKTGHGDEGYVVTFGQPEILGEYRLLAEALHEGNVVTTREYFFQTGGPLTATRAEKVRDDRGPEGRAPGPGPWRWASGMAAAAAGWLLVLRRMV